MPKGACHYPGHHLSEEPLEGKYAGHVLLRLQSYANLPGRNPTEYNGT